MQPGRNVHLYLPDLLVSHGHQNWLHLPTTYVCVKRAQRLLSGIRFWRYKAG
jgi:hypothetical protein